MKKPGFFFLFGIWSLIILGAGHLLTHFAFMFSSDPKPEIMNKMEEFIAPVPGWKIDLLSLHNGFSIMMGILLIAIGWLGFHSGRKNPEDKFILIFFLILGIIISFMSIKFFFVVPVVLSLLSIVSFLFALILRKNKQ